jgi:hypothetical protein
MGEKLSHAEKVTLEVTKVSLGDTILSMEGIPCEVIQIPGWDPDRLQPTNLVAVSHLSKNTTLKVVKKPSETVEVVFPKFIP